MATKEIKTGFYTIREWDGSESNVHLNRQVPSADHQLLEVKYVDDNLIHHVPAIWFLNHMVKFHGFCMITSVCELEEEKGFWEAVEAREKDPDNWF